MKEPGPPLPPGHPLVRALSPSRRRQADQALRKEHLRAVSEAIASPIELEPDPKRSDGYVLRESGQLIARWRESEHPGFAAWLIERLHERYHALCLARPEAKRIEDDRERGRSSGKQRDPTAKHADLTRLIRLSFARGEDPRQYATGWAIEYEMHRSTVYRLITLIEKRRPPVRSPPTALHA
jgi:hypothetical protein